MEKRRYFKQRIEEQQVALDRIKVLFQLGKQEYNKHPPRAHRYASMILSIIKKTRIRVPIEIKLFICKKCGHYLMSGKNLRVRSKEGMTIYECLDCGAKRKYGYLRERDGR